MRCKCNCEGKKTYELAVLEKANPEVFHLREYERVLSQGIARWVSSREVAMLSKAHQKTTFCSFKLWLKGLWKLLGSKNIQGGITSNAK